MIDALVFYGTPDKPCQDIYMAGIELFKSMKIKDYTIYIHRLNRLGYGVKKEISHENILELFDKELFNFEISFNKAGKLFYFSQSICAVSAFNVVNFGGFSGTEFSAKQNEQYAQQILKKIPCQYGFFYQASNPFTALNYVHDVGGMTIEQYDSPMKWQRKFMYSKNDEDYGCHLRLVYQLNFLTKAHLSLDINGQTLKEWIEAQDYRGSLDSINDDIWQWKVNPEKLTTINHECGAAGLLISFIEPSKNLIRRRLS